MKKQYIVTLLLITVFVPQVVSAAWWNPFSWSIFHRSDTKTEMLGNKVKELEDTLQEKDPAIDKVTKDANTNTSYKKPELPVKVVPIDPIIKIELCKTKAKESADRIARNAYTEAAFKMIDEGSEEAAQMYFDFADKPEHPVDYDSNYNAIYINCLTN